VPYDAKRDIHTKHAFSKLVSKIIHIKKSVEDSHENYERIGVIPIGMPDGLPSAYSKQGEVLVKGNRAPIIKVHTEHTRVNLSNSFRDPSWR